MALVAIPRVAYHSYQNFTLEELGHDDSIIGIYSWSPGRIRPPTHRLGYARHGGGWYPAYCPGWDAHGVAWGQCGWRGRGRSRRCWCAGVESALGFARDGFPTYQLLHRAIGSPERLANLHKYPDSARIYLPDGRPPALGSLFVQPDLARTLALMGEAEQHALGQGRSREAAIQAARDVFYKGDVARRMVQALQELG